VGAPREGGRKKLQNDIAAVWGVRSRRKREAVIRTEWVLEFLPGRELEEEGERVANGFAQREAGPTVSVNAPA